MHRIGGAVARQGSNEGCIVGNEREGKCRNLTNERKVSFLRTGNVARLGYPNPTRKTDQLGLNKLKCNSPPLFILRSRVSRVGEQASIRSCRSMR